MNSPTQVLVFDEDNYNSSNMANSSCLEQRFSEMGGMGEEPVATCYIKHVCYIQEGLIICPDF